MHPPPSPRSSLYPPPRNNFSSKICNPSMTMSLITADIKNTCSTNCLWAKRISSMYQYAINLLELFEVKCHNFMKGIMSLLFWGSTSKVNLVLLFQENSVLSCRFSISSIYFVLSWIQRASQLFTIVYYFQYYSKVQYSLLEIFNVICGNWNSASISQNYVVVNYSEFIFL